jgi:hypothetical protein
LSIHSVKGPIASTKPPIAVASMIISINEGHWGKFSRQPIFFGPYPQDVKRLALGIDFSDPLRLYPFLL